jgi:DNA-binding IclR family transcriptional regulator
MTSGALSRGLAVLQSLVGEPEGLSLSRVTELTGLPSGATTHRLLTTLVEEGFVQKVQPSGNYALTLQLASLGLRHLAGSTIAELALPVLAKLADESEQLVRLGLADGHRLLWVARTQGARSGLRYEPDVDHGKEVPLASSASGVAWLSRMSDDEALQLLARQHPEARHPMGPGAPTGYIDVLNRIHTARSRGWADVHDSFEVGIAAMAAPIVAQRRTRPLGVVSIAGPSLMLTSARMDELVAPLQSAAAQLASLAAALVTDGHPPRATGKRTGAT